MKKSDRWSTVRGLMGLTLALMAVAAGPRATAAQTDNLRLTVQLIQADGFQEADPAIRGVVDQLRSLFRFEGYRLLAEATMMSGVPSNENQVVRQRVAPNDEDAFGLTLILEGTPTPGVYRIGLNLTDGRMEHFSDGRLIEGARIMSVSFNARASQTVVVGSAKYDPNKPTLIVAVRFEPVT